MLGYGKDSHTYRVFNNVLHKFVEIADVRFDETNGPQRENLPSMIDQPAPEESIKFKATEDVIPTEESAEEFIPECENVELMHLKKMLKKMVLKKMLIKFLDDNLLILVLQKKCKLRRSSMTLKHQVLSHAQKLHIYLTFVGTMLLSLSQSPLR